MWVKHTLNNSLLWASTAQKCFQLHELSHCDRTGRQKKKTANFVVLANQRHSLESQSPKSCYDSSWTMIKGENMCEWARKRLTDPLSSKEGKLAKKKKWREAQERGRDRYKAEAERYRGRLVPRQEEGYQAVNGADYCLTSESSGFWEG